MSITYASFVSQMATITVISSTILETGDTNFGGIIPAAIDYAEGRIYRDLDIPAARVTDTSVTTSSGVRTVALSTTLGTLLEIESYNIMTPSGALSSNGTRVPLVPVSHAYVDAVYPSAISSNCGQPAYFARITDTQILFGPTPDQAYQTHVTAVIRPAPLSASNSSTWLTQNTPELMVAAGAIFLFGYMRDFGAQADDPKAAQSWENQYQALKATANADSLRQKFQSFAWTDSVQTPSPRP